jgi:hypothetical protein
MKRCLLTIATLLASAFALSACSSSTTFNGECKRDSDCAAYERCDTLDYRCVCSSDEACALGEYCNASGSCQVASGCFTNEDCLAGSICDTGSGECISADSCSRDEHCDIGFICESSRCRRGCRETADCDLGAREICLDGTCRLGMCENKDYCSDGLVCDTDSHSCVQPSEPYCATCDAICSVCGPGESPCGDPANICAGEDPVTYCWVHCLDSDDCPAGFHCVPTTESWATCTTDTDCNSVENTCGSASHRCALNQQVCDSSADCHDFGPATCLSGYCIFGQHCEPVFGGCQ